MKKSLLFLFAGILASGLSFGQGREIDYTNTRDGENVEYCVTHKKLNEMLKDPVFMKIYAADQARLKQREEEIKNSKQAGIVYTIPVVFHVLHKGGDENISREQIEDAMFILNRDYRLQNSDANNVVSAFQGMPSDVEIEFAFATKAPNGQCFGGITRTYSTATDDGDNGGTQVNAIINGNDIYNGEWPGDEYLNIFVCNDIGGAAGYTMKPFNSNWGGADMSNGIWVLHNYVGSIGTSADYSSRTLTHEVGHWLNLDHTWGGNNNPGNTTSCSTDDGVSDTPNTIGVTSCALTESTCGPLANVENYMDYSYCSKMFTQGQVDKMRAALTSNVANRDNLSTASNLAATGADTGGSPCAASFYGDKLTICAGDAVTFTDDSYNNISEWDWTFNGGTPSSSTDQNPVITYNTAGTYSVSLVAGDGSSTVNKTETAYITVLPAPGKDMPVAEGFEDLSSVPSTDWFVENPDGSQAWNVSTVAASTGDKSVRLYNYANQAGDEDELVSNTIDLSNMSEVTLSFKYAFAKKSDANDDKLQVLATYNCGETWLVRKTISTSQIATASNTSGNFVPAEADWKEITITNITSTYHVDNFRFKFKFTAGGGNNIYIDDINIWGLDGSGNPVGEANMTGVEELFEGNSVVLYPNPTSGNTKLTFELNNNSEDVSIQVLDMVGKRVLNVYNGQLPAGEQQFDIATEGLSRGVYHVLVQSEGRSFTQKLIVE